MDAAGDVGHNHSYGSPPAMDVARVAVIRRYTEYLQTEHDDAEKEEYNHAAANKWLSSPLFEGCISVLILAAAVQMGVEADHPDWLHAWFITENFFTAAFFLEMILKFHVLRCKYFKDTWNLFDFFLVILSVADVWIISHVGGNFDLQSLSILRVIRLARLGRLIRLIKRSERMMLIMLGVIDALRTTCSVGALVCVCIYICAIFCTTLIGNSNPDAYPGYSTEVDDIEQNEVIFLFNPYMSFGSMSRSMLTLFNMVIGAEWSEVVRPVALKQPYLIAFFMGFFVLITYGVMNVIIALIVDNVIQNAKTIEEQSHRLQIQGKLKRLTKISDLVHELDLNQDGRVSTKEMEGNMRIPALRELFRGLALPSCTSAEELMDLLDADGDGSLLFEEILSGLFRLIESNDFQVKCLLQMSINRVLRRIKENSAETKEIKRMIENLAISVQELRGEGGIATKADLTQLPTSRKKPTTNSSSSRCTERCGASLQQRSHQSPISEEVSAPADTTVATVKSIAAMSEKIEAKLVEMLGHLQINDEPCVHTVAKLCGSTVRDEVTAYMDEVRQDLESRLVDGLEQMLMSSETGQRQGHPGAAYERRVKHAADHTSPASSDPVPVSDSCRSRFVL